MRTVLPTHTVMSLDERDRETICEALEGSRRASQYPGSLDMNF